MRYAKHHGLFHILGRGGGHQEHKWWWKHSVKMPKGSAECPKAKAASEDKVGGFERVERHWGAHVWRWRGMNNLKRHILETINRFPWLEKKIHSGCVVVIQARSLNKSSACLLTKRKRWRTSIARAPNYFVTLGGNALRILNTCTFRK